MAGRHRRSFWSAVVVAVALVVGGGAVAYVGFERTGGADGAVRGYFAALRRGDAPAALGFGDVPDGPHALLTSTVLREQQRIGKISDVTIAKVTRHGDLATVDVRYDLAFSTTLLSVSDSVQVRKHGRSWHLTAVAARTKLDVLQAQDRASIVGAPVPDTAVLVFPGAAPVAVDSPFLQVDPDGSIITLSGTGDTSIGVVPSDAGRAMAHQALDAALAPCVTAKADPRCPLPSPRSVPGSVRGTLSPNGTNDVAVDVLLDAAGTLRMLGTVTVVGQYQQLDFNNVASTKRGAFKLQVNARAYPVAPLVIRWQQAST